jgi:putative FmdB family regulatory protein
MPIYEYLCDDCGTRFEKLVRNSDTGELLCPSCGERHLTQQLSVFSAHANGRAEASPGGCPAGMCRMPDVCGRN